MCYVTHGTNSPRRSCCAYDACSLFKLTLFSRKVRVRGFCCAASGLPLTNIDRWYQMYASILPNVTIERSLYWYASHLRFYAKLKELFASISLDFTLKSEESLSSMFCANEGGPGGPRIHVRPLLLCADFIIDHR